MVAFCHLGFPETQAFDTSHAFEVRYTHGFISSRTTSQWPPGKLQMRIGVWIMGCADEHEGSTKGTKLFVSILPKIVLIVFEVTTLVITQMNYIT